jgi:hypothetical protein
MALSCIDMTRDTAMLLHLDRCPGNSGATEVSAQDLSFMLLATVRYSLHRCSYAPSYAAELVLRYRSALTEQQAQQIREEVEKELQMAKRYHKYVGHECDHRTWRKLADNLAGKARSGGETLG